LFEDGIYHGSFLPGKDNSNKMVTRGDAPAHDLGSLRIHEGQRKGGKVGKGLAIFFGLLIILSGVGAGVYALLDRNQAVEVAVARKAGAQEAARRC
jgi:hypothetical protein